VSTKIIVHHYDYKYIIIIRINIHSLLPDTATLDDDTSPSIIIIVVVVDNAAT